MFTLGKRQSSQNLFGRQGGVEDEEESEGKARRGDQQDSIMADSTKKIPQDPIAMKTSITERVMKTLGNIDKINVVK